MCLVGLLSLIRNFHGQNTFLEDQPLFLALSHGAMPMYRFTECHHCRAASSNRMAVFIICNWSETSNNCRL